MCITRGYLSDRRASVVTQQPVAEREGKRSPNPATTSWKCRRRRTGHNYRRGIERPLTNVPAHPAREHWSLPRRRTIFRRRGDGPDGLAVNEGTDVGRRRCGRRCQGVAERPLPNSVLVPTAAYDVLSLLRYISTQPTHTKNAHLALILFICSAVLKVFFAVLHYVCRLIKLLCV